MLVAGSSTAPFQAERIRNPGKEADFIRRENPLHICLVELGKFFLGTASSEVRNAEDVVFRRLKQSQLLFRLEQLHACFGKKSRLCS